jgi:hypothetical protein
MPLEDPVTKIERISEVAVVIFTLQLFLTD